MPTSIFYTPFPFSLLHKQQSKGKITSSEFVVFVVNNSLGRRILLYPIGYGGGLVSLIKWVVWSGGLDSVFVGPYWLIFLPPHTWLIVSTLIHHHNGGIEKNSFPINPGDFYTLMVLPNYCNEHVFLELPTHVGVVHLPLSWKLKVRVYHQGGFLFP